MTRVTRLYSSLLCLAFISSTALVQAEDAPAAAPSAPAPSAATPEAPTPSLADQKAACASGFEQSQVFRQAGKLRASRKELLKCVQPMCSRPVQEQCNRWLEEVEHVTPTIVIGATAEGQDRLDVHVELDGEVLSDALNGTAIDVDPGPHVFKFAYSDYAPIEKTVVIREGDRVRKIGVSFRRKPVAEPVAVAPATTAPPPVMMHRPVPTLAYVLAGVAVVGGGAFAFLGSTAASRRTLDETSCSPTCADSEVSSLHTRLVAADVSLGVGIAALLGATIVYASRPTVPVEEPRLTGDLNLSPHAVGARAALRF